MHESLVSKFTDYFPKRNRSVLKNIMLLSLCILHKENICLNRLKGIVGIFTGKRSKSSSNYKRLIRIFDNHSLSNLWLELLIFGFRLFRFKVEFLIIDGTSWKRGTRWFHFMTLCIVYRGVAIPIYWEDLSKHGLSNFKERKSLMDKAMKYFDLEGKTLLGDREYIGKDWFNYLINNKINFVVRIKRNIYKQYINEGKGRTHQQITNKVLRSKKSNKAVAKMIELDELSLKFVAVKNPKNDPKDPVIYLLTNHTEKAANEIAYNYCLRTKIEHCFKHLKSNGFNLEQINLRKKSRCRLLMAITVFTYTLSIHEGLKEYDKVPRKIYAKYKPEKAVSVFRFGLNRLAQFTKSLEEFCMYFFAEIHFAEKKYKSPFWKMSSS